MTLGLPIASILVLCVALVGCGHSVLGGPDDGIGAQSGETSREEASEKSGVIVPAPAESAERDAEAAAETLSPRERDRRGDEHLFAGRFDQAIADFDAFLEAEPEFDPHHWRRGIAYYYAGRYEEGAAQFVRHRTVNPDDVENAAWHFLCLARATNVDEARAAILPVGPDQRDPMMEVYELFAGQGTPEQVLEKASSSPQSDALFFAHLYLGLYQDALGDKQKAREHIELAATTHGRTHYMGRVARVHASLLNE